MKNLTLLLTLVIYSQCSSPTQQPADSLTPRLDSIGQSFIDQGQILGFSIAIMKGVDTLYNKGFGYSDIEKTTPVTNETRFLMASVSKLIGATLVMKLVDEGILSLDQTLFELLPDYPNPKQAKQITLKHMLSHTSGLPDYAAEIDSVFIKTGMAPTKADIYEFLKNRDFLFEPASDYSYCNTGFYLMSLIVEKVTGATFQQEIDRVINQPTAMNLELIATATDDPLMSPYWELDDTSFAPYPHWTWIKGDGGLTATPLMLAQFPNLWATGQIISSESFKKMSTPIVLTDGIQTGYGIGVRNGKFLGEKIIGHTGGHKSTYSIMVYFPERDLTFVAFMNTDNSPTSIRLIFAEFAREVLGKETPNHENQETLINDLTIYEGTYRNFDHKMSNEIVIELNTEDNHLYYCIEDGCLKMYSTGEHQFWIPDWPYDFVSFHIDENGKSLAIKEYYTGFYSVLRQKITNK